MKANEKNTGAAAIAAVAVLCALVSFTSGDSAVNVELEIRDTDPYYLNITSIWFAGLKTESSFTPSAGTNYLVTANVTVGDYNGYQDINKVWALMFYGGNQSKCDEVDELDDDICYHNTSCAAVAESGNGNYRNYTCAFDVKYYADYGLWNITVFVNDTNGGGNLSNSTSRTINSLKSISTPPTINFGSRSPGEVTQASIKQEIENTGNADVYVTVQGSGDMNCSVRGTVSVSNIRYVSDLDGGSGKPYAGACGILNTTDSWGCQTLTVYDEEDPTTASYKQSTYWAINVTEGVAGACSNTITFTAN